jgi:putative FmdB family regulatory protein
VPTYQYACTECGHAFEQVQSFSEDALTVCPNCQGKLRKVYNAVGVVFKGSGFYRNDSRSSGTGSDVTTKASGDSSSSSSDSSSGGETKKSDSGTKTESKPAAPSTSSSTPSSSSTS